MRKYLIPTLVVFCVIGCFPYDPTPPTTTTTVPSSSGLLCENMYSVDLCNDGSRPQACISRDGSRCGVKVKGRMFYCSNCAMIDYGGCDSAIYSAVSYCYGYASDSSFQDLDLEGIEMTVTTFKDELEFFVATQ